MPTTNWYYAVNGQTSGPFTLQALREQYSSGSIGDETYVWHEALTDWKPVATVDAFADALAQGQRLSPRRKTIGFSGQLEAVRSATGPSKAREGAVPVNRGAASPQKQSSPAPRPDEPEKSVSAQSATPSRESSAPSRPGSSPGPRAGSERVRPEKSRASAPESASARNPASGSQQSEESGHQPALRTPSPAAKSQAPTPESRPLKDARKEKLDRLRARLGGTFGKSDEDETEEKEQPSGPKLEPAEASPTTSSTDLSQDQLPTLDESALPRPVGGGAVLTFAEGVSGDGEETVEDPPDKSGPDAVDFDLPPRAHPSKPSPSSTSDILEQVIGPVDEPARDASAVDSGVIPFFDEAPKLEGQAAREVTGAQEKVTSGSLLIDLQNIKKKGRGKRVFAVIGFVVVLVGIGSAAAYMYMNRPAEREPVAHSDEPEVPSQKDELVIPTYSKDERAKLDTMDLEEEFLFSEDEAEAESQAEQAKEQAAREERAAAEQKGTGAASSGSGTKKPRKPRHEPENTEEATPTAVATTQEQPSMAAQTEPVEKEPRTLREALLKQRRELEVRAPKDKLREQLENKTGLSKDEARRGFRKVKDSVRVCRERHNRRAAAMDAKKIKLSVKVQPNGRVSSFDASPKSIRNSEFERCMQSHKGRWRFAQFRGDPVVINTSIILQ